MPLFPENRMPQGSGNASHTYTNRTLTWLLGIVSLTGKGFETTCMTLARLVPTYRFQVPAGQKYF
eukprot:4710215-Amphidinium_carterae.1